MKKIFMVSMVLIVMVIGLMFGNNVYAATSGPKMAEARVDVTSNKEILQVGETFEVSLVLSELVYAENGQVTSYVDDIAKVEGYIRYDSEYLELVNSTLSAGGASDRKFTVTDISKKKGDVLATFTFKVRDNIQIREMTVKPVEFGYITVSDSTGDSTEVKLENKNYARIEILPTVTDVIITPREATIEVGEKAILTADVKPDGVANKNVKWISSNDSIATVENGIVTGIKEGNVTITAITESGNKRAEAKITVKKSQNSNPTDDTKKDDNKQDDSKKDDNTTVNVTGVKVTPINSKIVVGKSVTLIATISPENATNKNLKWVSSDEKIATVTQNGVVTGVAEGTVEISVITEDGQKVAKSTVTVEKETVIPDDNNKVDDTKEPTNNTNQPTKVDDNKATDNKVDNTVANTELPKAGTNMMILGVIALISVISIIIYKKKQKFNDIK